MKIALLGSAPSSRLLAPFHDQNFEIWACSPANHDLPRVDAWFELHDLDRKLTQKKEAYERSLAVHPRVYVTLPDPRLPNAIIFDWKPLVEKYGPWFFSSSLSWMMAAAIEVKPEEIGLWGIDLAAKDEYKDQRPGLHFFIREAEKVGIKVTAPPQSDILAPPALYAIKEHWPMFKKFKVKRLELEVRIAAAKKQEDDALNQRLFLEGALDSLDYMDATWMHE